MVYSANPTHQAERDYLDWRQPSKVVDRARIFFYQGQPYAGALGSFADRLNDANKIRDRVAHSSTKAISEFKRVARRLRGAQLHQGYRVGDLMLSTTTGHFGHAKYSANRTVFEAYKRIYEEAARRIVLS